MLAKRMKKSLALLLATVMVLGLLPVSAFAAGSDRNGHSTQVVTNPGLQTMEDGKLKVQKSIKQVTDSSGNYVENQFDVTLKVETTEKTIKTGDNSAAVVIVLDVSNSMDGNVKKAQDAAKMLVSKLLKDSDGEPISATASRKIAVVEFGTDAYTVLNWTESNGVGLDTVNSAIESTEIGFLHPYTCLSDNTQRNSPEKVSAEKSDIKFGFESALKGKYYWECRVCGAWERYDKTDQNPDWRHTHYIRGHYDYDEHIESAFHDPSQGPKTAWMRSGGGTNIEGGLRLANNLLKQESVSGIGNRFVVMLTDGVPTSEVLDKDETDSIVYMLGDGGSAVNPEDYKDITGNGAKDDKLALQIKNAPDDSVLPGRGADLFTINFGATGNVGGLTVNEWLSSFANQNIYVNAPGGLEPAFSNVATIIQNMLEAWIITDPMGNYMVFDEKGNESLSVNYDPASRAVLTYDRTSDTLKWDLKKEIDPSRKTVTNTGSGDNRTTKYTYTLTYRINLDTAGVVVDEQGVPHPFQGNTPYPTNKETTLTYIVKEKKTVDGKPVEEYSDERTAKFDVPAVEGFTADFTLNKRAAGNDAKIEGAGFSLNGPGYASGNKTTDRNGQIKFEGIPSGGYSYTLAEVSAPEPYDKDSGAGHTVTVDWGVATLKKNGDPVADNTILNTYLTGEQEITASKIWQDGDDVSHPHAYLSLTQKLNGQATGNVYYEAIGGSTEDSQTVTFTVPVRDGVTGVKYTYDLGEAVDVNGVKTDAASSGISGYAPPVISQQSMTVINTRSNNSKSIEVTKNWINADGNAAPGDVTITLTGKDSTGEVVKTESMVLAKDANSVTFINLPEFDAYGLIISYTASDSFGGYAAANGGETNGAITLTNVMDVSDKTSISGTKVWNDGGNEDSDRPASIQVQVYDEDGNAAHLITAKPDENGAWNFTTGAILDKYHVTEDGDGNVTAISLKSYYVRELDADGEPVNVGDTVTYSYGEEGETTTYQAGYSSNSDGSNWTITNTRFDDTGTSFEVVKQWNDSNNKFDTRPETFTVKLYADGVEQTDKAQEVQSVSGSGTDDDTDPTGNRQTVSWEKLPVFNSEGKRIVYTAGDNIPGYEAGVYVPAGGDSEENTLTNELTDADAITGSKLWQDGGNADNTRPTSITVELINDRGEVVDAITVEAPVDQQSRTITSANEWPFSFTGMPKYYTETVHHEAETEEKPVLGENGESTGETETVITKEAYDEIIETEIVYTVRERTPIKNYTATRVTAGAEENYQLINTATGSIDVDVSKTWVDQSNDFETRAVVEFELRKQVPNGEGGTTWEKVDAKNLTVGEDSVRFTAAKYDDSGARITYQVVENLPASAPYSSSHTGGTPDQNGDIDYTFTNILQQQTTQVSGTKSWTSLPGVTTPDTIKVQVYKDNVAYGQPMDVTLGEGGAFTISSVTLPAAEEETASTVNLDKYTISGSGVNTTYQLHTYTLKECDAQGNPLDTNAEITYGEGDDAVTYQVTYNGNTITNTQKLSTTNFAITKHWGDPEGTKHPEAAFTLYQWLEGSKTGYTETWTTTADNTSVSESHTFTDLPYFTDDHSGRTYSYTVEETVVPEGYHTVDVLDEHDEVIPNQFKNVINSAYVTISGTKTWQDPDGTAIPDAAYPEKIVVELYRSGTEEPIDIQEVTPVTSGDAGQEVTTWSYSFTVADGMYDANGSYIQYYVKEQGADSTTGQITYGDHIFAPSYDAPVRNEDGSVTADITNTRLSWYNYVINAYYRTITNGVEGAWSEPVKKYDRYGLKDETYTLARIVGEENVSDTLAGWKTYGVDSDYALLETMGTQSVTLTDPTAVYEISYYFQRSESTSVDISVTHEFYLNGVPQRTEGPETKSVTYGDAVTAASYAKVSELNGYALDMENAEDQNISSVHGGESITLKYYKNTYTVNVEHIDGADGAPNQEMLSAQNVTGVEMAVGEVYNPSQAATLPENYKLLTGPIMSGSNAAGGTVTYTYTYGPKDSVNVIINYLRNDDHQPIYELPQVIQAKREGDSFNVADKIYQPTAGEHGQYLYVTDSTKTEEDQDGVYTGTLGTEDLTINVYYNVERYPYKVVFYNDYNGGTVLGTVSSDDMMAPYGTVLTNEDMLQWFPNVTDWVNSRRPSGYNAGTVTYPTIGVSPEGAFVLDPVTQEPTEVWNSDPITNIVAVHYGYTPSTGGGDDDDPPTPPAVNPPVNPPVVTPPETDIPDAEPPLGGSTDEVAPPAEEMDIGDSDVPLSDGSDVIVDNGDEIEIVDEGTPLGNLPQTGTMTTAVNPTATQGYLAFAASLAAAGLAFVIGRKKEEDEEA